MAEYPQLGIVSKGNGSEYIFDLQSPSLHRCRIEIEKGKARLHCTSQDFYKIFLSILQETGGDHIGVHLPSHGLGNHDKDLDMVEAFAENMSRILREMGEDTDWNTLISQVVKRRMAEKRGLESGADTTSR
ncbi:hypothetical protein KW785_00785 [Candidatus Parcubacteria bacterium]|nr:hypothetical protein [Candidatus Parcubacteria bacterium]